MRFLQLVNIVSRRVAVQCVPHDLGRTCARMLRSHRFLPGPQCTPVSPHARTTDVRRGVGPGAGHSRIWSCLQAGCIASFSPRFDRPPVERLWGSLAHGLGGFPGARSVGFDGSAKPSQGLACPYWQFLIGYRLLGGFASLCGSGEQVQRRNDISLSDAG